MALVGRQDGRNFGYGRQLSYAGPQALKDLFGGGHYGTVKAHSDRWQAFVRWCRSEDGPRFNDARQIDRQTLVDYAGHLRQQVAQGAIGIATAQNRLSSVNRTMAALRGDQSVKAPGPRKALGMQRASVRRSVPQGQDREQVKGIIDALCEKNPCAAAIMQLARATGMRSRGDSGRPTAPQARSQILRQDQYPGWNQGWTFGGICASLDSGKYSNPRSTQLCRAGLYQR